MTNPAATEIVSALIVARSLAGAGIPIFVAKPALDAAGNWAPTSGTGGTGYVLPNKWQHTVPDPAVVDTWALGDALCAVGGHGVDYLDLDPRNGGQQAREDLAGAGLWPLVIGQQATPSGGTHDLVNGLNVGSRDGVLPGLDVKAGATDGSGRGFVFLAPTMKLSKSTGEISSYRWTIPPNLDELDPPDQSGAALAARIRALRQSTATVDDTPHVAWDAMDADQQQRIQQYLAGTVASEKTQMAKVAQWPVDYRDPSDEKKTRGWQKITADLCNRFGQLARADWTPWTMRDARNHLTAIVPAPIDTAVDLEQTWLAQCGRREPAHYPAALNTTVTVLPPIGGNTVTVGTDVPTEDLLASPAGDADDYRSTWVPVDIADTVSGILNGTVTRHTPTIGTCSDGRALFYAGKVNGVAGASGSGKSWTALHTAHQEITAGRHIIYVDLEDDAIGVIGRLLDLGADPGDILTGFHYIHPDEPYGLAATKAMSAALTEHEPSLVVLDSTGESMALDGAKPNDDDDTARWFRRLPTAVANTGPAVIVLDHVVKADDGGLWPIGSQRKRAAISGAQYMQTTVRPFARGRAGQAKLICAKDRHGNYRIGQKVADLTVEPDGDQLQVTFVEADDRVSDGSAPFRPTSLMEKVSRAVEASSEALSFRSIDRQVTGKQEHKRTAVTVLVGEGFLTRVDAPRNATLHSSVRPYRQDDDPLSDVFVSGIRSTLKSASHEPVTVSRPMNGDGRRTLNPIPDTDGVHTGYSPDGLLAIPGEPP